MNTTTGHGYGAVSPELFALRAEIKRLHQDAELWRRKCARQAVVIEAARAAARGGFGSIAVLGQELAKFDADVVRGSRR